MELKGSKTEKNLMEAFAGESQARNKYTYFASKAKKEGYEQIAAIFQETADNEKEHAKLWFKLLHDEDIPSTAENLKAAATIILKGRKKKAAGDCRFLFCRSGGSKRMEYFKFLVLSIREKAVKTGKNATFFRHAFCAKGGTQSFRPVLR